MRVSFRTAIGGGVSDPRNATLMKMFSLIGIGDRAGMGIPDLIDIWQRLTGFAPVYFSQFSPNRVNVSLQIKAIGDKLATNGQVGDKSAINGRIGDKSEGNFTVEQKLSAIIEYMQNHPSVSAAEIAEVLSIKASRTRDYMRILVERGVLLIKGANKNRAYVLKRQ